MRIDIITAIPSLLVSPFNDSIIKRAQEKNLVNKCEFEKTILEKEINEISSKINFNKSKIKEKSK